MEGLMMLRPLAAHPHLIMPGEEYGHVGVIARGSIGDGSVDVDDVDDNDDDAAEHDEHDDEDEHDEADADTDRVMHCQVLVVVHVYA